MKFIDGHCDSITTAMAKGENLNNNSLHIDFKRLEESGCLCQFFAIWLEKSLYEDAFCNTIKAIDFFEKQIKNSKIRKITTYKELENNIKNNFISAILTAEGGEALEGKIENIEKLYNKGIRLITLCWNYENELGYGAATGSEKGLKPFGLEAVKKMNELNIFIDVSHLNEAGFWDVYNNSKKPFVASHSNAYKICSHCRNLTDNQLKAVAEKKGIIGLNLFPPFLNDSGRADMNDVLKHADYIINLIGEDYLTLGCDFDGIDKEVESINSVSDLIKIYDCFTVSFGKKISDKIFYENYLCFLKNNLY